MRNISADELVDVIYRDVFVAAVDDSVSVLENPPGRAPRTEDRRMQEWYRGLPEIDQANVRIAMQKAADYAVFGMLCLLDNSRPIADGFEQELRLSIESNGTRVDIDPEEPLHEIFRAKVDLPESG